VLNQQKRTPLDCLFSDFTNWSSWNSK